MICAEAYLPSFDNHNDQPATRPSGHHFEAPADAVILAGLPDSQDFLGLTSDRACPWPARWQWTSHARHQHRAVGFRPPTRAWPGISALPRRAPLRRMQFVRALDRAWRLLSGLRYRHPARRSAWTGGDDHILISYAVASGDGRDACSHRAWITPAGVPHMTTPDTTMTAPRCIRAEPDREPFVASQPNVTGWHGQRVRSGPLRGRSSGGSDGPPHTGRQGFAW
jgi:hypothetical protein